MGRILSIDNVVVQRCQSICYFEKDKTIHAIKFMAHLMSYNRLIKDHSQKPPVFVLMSEMATRSLLILLSPLLLLFKSLNDHDCVNFVQNETLCICILCLHFFFLPGLVSQPV